MSERPYPVDNTEHFVQQLAEHQNRLFGYVYSLVGDHTRAADVVQETNLVLWRKSDEFDPSRPFLPWAFAVARFQVLAHVRDHSRDKSILSEELVELLASDAEEQAGRLDDVQSALRVCLTKLPSDGRALIEGRYLRGRSVSELAGDVGKGLSAVKVSLMRMRRKLAECVKARMTEAAS